MLGCGGGERRDRGLWGKVRGDGGEEVWESVWGECGGCGKMCWGGEGRCGGEKKRGDLWENVWGEGWEVCWGVGEVRGEVWGCREGKKRWGV